MKEKTASTENPDEIAAQVKESKSQRKRAMEALQQLGESLISLSSARLNRLPISASLRQAIDEAKSITSRGALRRQKQLIGRLMRQEDVAKIKESLEVPQQKKRAEIEYFHAAERWRDRLLSGEENAVMAFIAQYPQAQITQLRQLVRHAIRDRDGKTGNRSRALFRYIHSLINPA